MQKFSSFTLLACVRSKNGNLRRKLNEKKGGKPSKIQQTTIISDHRRGNLDFEKLLTKKNTRSIRSQTLTLENAIKNSTSLILQNLTKSSQLSITTSLSTSIFLQKKARKLSTSKKIIKKKIKTLTFKQIDINLELLQNSQSFPRVEKMMRETSASQRTESSQAFLRRPLRRLAKVTCLLILFSILFSSTLPLPICSLESTLLLLPLSQNDRRSKKGNPRIQQRKKGL